MLEFEEYKVKLNNKKPALEALREAGREDLIGYDKRCLIRPARDKQSGKPLSTKKPARSGRRSSNQNRNRQK